MSTDLLYTDVEESLRASTLKFLDARLSTTALARCYDGDDSVREVWTPFAAQIGVAGLLVPEELGGAGASAREAAVVAEALGRTLAPVPFLTSAVVATRILVATGTAEPLQAMVEGSTTVVLGVPLSTQPGQVPHGVLAADGRLSGSVRSVAEADRSSAVIIVAHSVEGTLELHLVETELLDLTPVVSFDMTRPLSDLLIENVEGTLLASGDIAEAVLADALLHGAAILASEQLGVAQWCLETTLDYVKTRHQFGRAIGSYQAVKHRLADLWVEVVHATAAARYAADCIARVDDDRHVAVSLAQACCSDVAVHAAEQAIQLHGGIGMTWEHAAHLYLKRAKADQVAFGTAEWHRTHLSSLLDLAL